MGSIPAPPGAGPACAGQETFAVEVNQINVFLFELAAPAGCCNFFSSFRPRRIQQRQLSLPQSSCAIRRGADEAQDPSQA